MLYPKMLRDLVLVKIPKPESNTKLEMPDSVKEMQEAEFFSEGVEGEAVAVGPECTVKNGDTIVAKGYVGNNLPKAKVDDSRHWYKVIAENDIMCFYRSAKKVN